MSDVSVVSTINYRPLDDSLIDCGWNVYTQFGEDGLIESVFGRIGVRNHWCFEVGASDGFFYSNTLRLREHGWSSVLVEGSADQFASLSEKYSSERVHCVHEHTSNLDDVLRRFDVPNDLDFGVIDIDGQDYWLWNDMELYRPRVMLVEFHWQDGEAFIPPRDINDQRQAGKQALMALGEAKGYIPVAETHVNLLLVQESEWRSN